MSDRKYYVICEQGCRFESMTKEQILAAITQAVEEGKIGDIDTGFVSKVKTINERTLRFFCGTQSEYDALSEDDKKNTLAVITNETLVDDIVAEIKRQLSSGGISVEYAETAGSLNANEIQIAEIKGNASLLMQGNGVQALTAGRTYIITIRSNDSSAYNVWVLYIPKDYISGAIVHSSMDIDGAGFQWKDGTLYFCDGSGRYAKVTNVTIREI